MSTSTTHSVIRLLKRTSGNRRLLLAALFFSTAVTGGILALSHLIRIGVDVLLINEGPDYIVIAGSLVLLIIGTSFVTLGERFTIGRYAEKTVAHFRSALVAKVNMLPMEYIDQEHSGDLVSRITNDLNLVREFVSSQFLPFFQMPLTAIGALVYMLTVSWQLTLVTVAITPILAALVSIVSKPMNQASRDLQDSLGNVNSQAQDSLAGTEIVKSFALEDIQDQKYGEQVDMSVRSGLALAVRSSLLQCVSVFSGIVPFFVCFAFGGYLATQGLITLGAFLAFINLLNHLSHPLSALPQLVGQAHTAMAAYNRIEEVFALEPERKTGWACEPLGEAVVEFDDVTFAYNQEPILKGLSLTVKKGETIALVGPSGGGKSTVLKLITAFYSPQRGEIRLFGNSIEDWDLESLRSRMALVTQDTFLFPGSVLENIAYGKWGASVDKVHAAARMANATPFVEMLEDGFQTVVGERGSRLSGGQKQRLAIARAILKDAPLLLLDEPTSALDTESEDLVQQALDRFLVGRTAIVVAHRLSTIKKADRVLVIDGGQVVEEGTHAELLASKGLYFALYRQQHRQEGGEEANEIQDILASN